MRIALLADLHANREATEACLSALRGLGCTQYVFLGDLVGYGADPAWVVDTVRGLRRRLYRDPQPPRARRPEIPRWFQEIVLRCLEVDPDARYPTAAQLAFDLQHPEQVPPTERAAGDGRDRHPAAGPGPGRGAQ